MTGRPGRSSVTVVARAEVDAGVGGGLGEAVDDLAVAESGIEERPPARARRAGDAPGQTGAVVDGDAPPGQLARELAGVEPPQLGRHRAVEPGQRLGAEAGPHELGVRAVGGATPPTGHEVAGDAGADARRHRPQRGRRPGGGSAPTARPGAGGRCGSAPGGRHRAARRAGPAPAGGADGCSRWLPRSTRWPPTTTLAAIPPSTGAASTSTTDRPRRAAAERGAQAGRSTADDEDVGRARRRHQAGAGLVALDGDQAVAGRRARPAPGRPARPARGATATTARPRRSRGAACSTTWRPGTRRRRPRRVAVRSAGLERDVVGPGHRHRRRAGAAGHVDGPQLRRRARRRWP